MIKNLLFSATIILFFIRGCYPSSLILIYIFRVKLLPSAIFIIKVSSTINARMHKFTIYSISNLVIQLHLTSENPKNPTYLFEL